MVTGMYDDEGGFDTVGMKLRFSNISCPMTQWVSSSRLKTVRDWDPKVS